MTPQVIPGQLWTVRAAASHGGIKWRVDRIEGSPPLVVLRAEGFYKRMSPNTLMRDYQLMQDIPVDDGN